MSTRDAPSTLPLPVTPTLPTATIPSPFLQSTNPESNANGNANQVVGRDQVSERMKAYSPPTLHPQVMRQSRSATPNSHAPATHLSSPPPTVESCVDTLGGSDTDVLSISDEHISQASPERLRTIVTNLIPALQEARTDAAHYRLQYQMLTIESAEAVERIQVEMDMAQRELEVLQAVDQQNIEAADAVSVPSTPVVDPSIRSVHVDLYNAMTSEIQDLKSRNLQHESVVAQQKKMIIQQEGEIASMNDRILLLRDRLQENRDQRNRHQRPSAAPEGTPRSERSPLPLYRPRPTQEQRPFAALLHATDLMSHDAPSMPSTPKRKRGQAPSMPVTPQTVQPRSSRNIYETPQSFHPSQYKAPMSAPAPKISSFTNRVASIINTTPPDQDSDGTVSATDDSEAETEVPDEEDVEESQASLMARDLLRTPTRPSTKQRQQQQRNLDVSYTQSRLFGQVKKSGVQREDDERQLKRAKAGGDNLGLGVAGFRAA